MKNFIKKLNLRPYKIVVSVLLFSGIWLYFSYTHPRNIYYNYKAMEFQNGFTGVAKPVVIQINGEYTNSILGSADSFSGEIKVGNKAFDFTKRALKFNKDKVGILVWNTTVGSAYSIIYVSPMLKEIVIQNTDLYIAAPCRHRTLAVEVANVKDYLISSRISRTHSAKA